VNPAEWSGGLAYLGIYLAAAVEGEVVFAAAAVMVAAGELNGILVLVSAALGGASGDNFYYYIVRGALHGHVRRLLGRLPALARRHQAVVEQVRRHQTAMILACRLLPGLRVAIPAACAYAEVPAWRFTPLNLVSAFIWATSIMAIVAWGGPHVLERLGLRGWLAALLPAAILLLFFWWLGRATRRLEKEEG
jgi:membrane-associated protein